MLNYQSVAEIVELAKDGKLSDVVLADQSAYMEIPESEILERMKNTLDVMRNSAEEGLKAGLRSVSDLSGGDGHRMYQFASKAMPLSGLFAAKATALAIGIQEYNAAMGKIVAAPTAGSCGILPAGVLTMMEERGASEESAIKALITAGAIGMVIATNATVSGAAGGCQAECGSAAAMTGAALVEMMGGTAQMSAHAAAIALQNQMGLVCDPVAGLVEVPCILRNGGGISIAINAADLAMAGVESVIPIDEVIIAMGEVGKAIPESLRETSLGGLAATPTGIAIKERLFGDNQG
ncbi:MAG: L-serine ammonia-lyase, iron-sulfur-dependent, subunit alpha [Defluviitaleaceae bacterium]|nr:L-serine ammonia-lyase, iron-sulfur-dependent, subunit alpha [Defluviitaleaceae bacterium]